ncbi:hypothetical protein [Leptolyngbya sp. Cla-17]|nr:hypothetical protein [Leptolyngbya sp. Cla-17]
MLNHPQWFAKQQERSLLLLGFYRTLLDSVLILETQQPFLAFI